MQLYDSFFPANSPNQAPMAEQNNAAYLHKQFEDLNDRIGQFVGVVDNLNALIKSQNETIAELSAKNGQQANQVELIDFKKEIIFLFHFYIIRLTK
jgi:hypothetical protein